MINKSFKVLGMSCEHCVKAVEIELKQLDLSNFNVTIGTVEVEYDQGKIKDENIINAIEEAGFKVNV